MSDLNDFVWVMGLFWSLMLWAILAIAIIAWERKKKVDAYFSWLAFIRDRKAGDKTFNELIYEYIKKPDNGLTSGHIIDYISWIEHHTHDTKTGKTIPFYKTHPELKNIKMDGTIKT
jgi:hypothetical protein